MPAIPSGGINKKPNIRRGFNIILSIKDKIKTFLYVFVSPSACSKEFKATTSIKMTEPEKIISVY